MLDIGLMQRLCQVPVELELQQENLLVMYWGKLAEQFVGQELLAWHSSDLYYWSGMLVEAMLRLITLLYVMGKFILLR